MVNENVYHSFFCLCWFIYSSFIHLFIRSFVHSFIYSFIHSFSTFKDTLLSFSFQEILSTRSNTNGVENDKRYVDIRCGDLQTQKVVRIETPKVSKNFSFFFIRFNFFLSKNIVKSYVSKFVFLSLYVFFFGAFPDSILRNFSLLTKDVVWRRCFNTMDVKTMLCPH